MINARNACTFVFNTKNIRTAIPIARPINILSPLSPFTIVDLLFFLFYYFIKFGAYFAASKIASIMLTALTIPFPAMSNAVP